MCACGGGATKRREPQLGPPKPRSVKFEVATATGVRRFDNAVDARREKRPGAIVRTVRA